jgi:hypothetical protein
MGMEGCLSMINDLSQFITVRHVAQFKMYCTYTLPYRRRNSQTCLMRYHLDVQNRVDRFNPRYFHSRSCRS